MTASRCHSEAHGPRETHRATEESAAGLGALFVEAARRRAAARSREITGRSRGGHGAACSSRQMSRRGPIATAFHLWKGEVSSRGVKKQRREGEV